MIKLQAPFNCTQASHDGVVYKANKKGVMTVPLEAANDLIKFHKFVNLTVAESEDDEDEALVEKPKKAKEIKEEVPAEVSIDEDDFFEGE